MNKPYHKSKLNKTFCELHADNGDIVFCDFKTATIDGNFLGHIKIHPKFVSYSLLSRYDEKVSSFLADCGFATISLEWNIDTSKPHIEFFANTEKFPTTKN